MVQLVQRSGYGSLVNKALLISFAILLIKYLVNIKKVYDLMHRWGGRKAVLGLAIERASIDSVVMFVSFVGEALIGLSDPKFAVVVLRSYLGCLRASYGNESGRQVIDLYLPTNKVVARPCVVFVHGGAWSHGSGFLYSAVGSTLRDQGYCVAVITYRAYPHGDVEDQIDDVALACHWVKTNLSPTYYNGSIVLIGHSAGAHLSLSAILTAVTLSAEGTSSGSTSPATRYAGRDRDTSGLELQRRLWYTTVMNHVKLFIGLAGPYEISKHYIFEANRGVEWLSPMKPAMRGRRHFQTFSPPVQLNRLNQLARQLSEASSVNINSNMDSNSSITGHSGGGAPNMHHLALSRLPKITLLHGDIDDTVPWSSSSEVYEVIKESKSLHNKVDDVKLTILTGVDHVGIIFNVMGKEYPHSGIGERINGKDTLSLITQELKAMESPF